MNSTYKIGQNQLEKIIFSNILYGNTKLCLKISLKNFMNPHDIIKLKFGIWGSDISSQKIKNYMGCWEQQSLY